MTDEQQKVVDEWEEIICADGAGLCPAIEADFARLLTILENREDDLRQMQKTSLEACFGTRVSNADNDLVRGCNALLWTASEFELLSFSSFAFHLALRTAECLCHLLLVYVCVVTNRTNNHDRIAYMWKNKAVVGASQCKVSLRSFNALCSMGWSFVVCWMYDILDHFFFRHETQSSMSFSILALVFFVARKFRAVGRVGREVSSVKFKCGVRRAQCEVWSVRFGVWRKQWEVWSVKCEWSVECEVRSEKCEVWSVKFGVGRKQWEVRSVKCGPVKCGVWSVECEVRSEKCEVRSVKEAVRSEKCGVWSAKWEVWSVKFGVWSEAVRSEKCEMYEVWSVKCEVRSVDCEVWSVKCGLWSTKCEVWTVKCEVWSVDCEVWSVKCGLWSVKCAVWSVKCEVWGLECEGSSEKWEVWSVKCGVWSLKFGVRRVQCAVWGVECRGKDTVGTGCLWTIGHLCLGNFRRRLARVYVRYGLYKLMENPWKSYY